MSQELIQHVYGFSLESLHSTSDEMARKLSHTQTIIQSGSRTISASEPLHEKEIQMRSDHVGQRIFSGKYYQLCKGREGDESYVAFQVVCMHPERRMYVQRLCFLGTDVPGWFW